jgi:hypothetical protein
MTMHSPTRLVWVINLFHLVWPCTALLVWCGSQYRIGGLFNLFSGGTIMREITSCVWFLDRNSHRCWVYCWVFPLESLSAIAECLLVKGSPCNSFPWCITLSRVGQQSGKLPFVSKVLPWLLSVYSFFLKNSLLNLRSIAIPLQGPSAIAESVPLSWRTLCSSLILHHFNASGPTVGCIAIRLQGPSAIAESVPLYWRTLCSIRMYVLMRTYKPSIHFMRTYKPSACFNANVQTKCTF